MYRIKSKCTKGIPVLCSLQNQCSSKIQMHRSMGDIWGVSELWRCTNVWGV